MNAHTWIWGYTRKGNRLALHPGARRFIVCRLPQNSFVAYAIDGDDEAGGVFHFPAEDLPELVRNIELDAECKAAERARLEGGTDGH